MKSRRFLGYVAVALVCVMLGSGLTLVLMYASSAQEISRAA